DRAEHSEDRRAQGHHLMAQGLRSNPVSVQASSTSSSGEADQERAGIARLPLSAGSGEVRLAARGLRKSFGSVVVADGGALDARAGGALGISAPRGAGKPTLSHLLGGSLRADAGTVELGAVDVSDEPPHRRCRRGLARTQQIPRPFGDLSVYENAL